MTRVLSRLLGVAVAAAMAGLLAGCGIHIPVDPDGSLDRITGGELRAGASPSESLVMATGEGKDVEVFGPLPSVIEDFAADRGAVVTWTIGSEEDLVDLLEAGQIDLAIGGMTDATPWSERVSVTRGFPGLPGAAGRKVVVLLPLGENGLQSALEEFLDGEVE